MTGELSRAISELDEAAGALDVAMSALRVAPRAEKQGISAALERALERLCAARAVLTALERTVKDA